MLQTNVQGPQCRVICCALHREQVPNTVLQTGDQRSTQAVRIRPPVLTVTVMLLLQAHLESSGQAVIPLDSVVPPHSHSAVCCARHQEPVLQLVELVQESH